MTSVNQQPDFTETTLEALILSNLKHIEEDKKNGDPKALLATLAQSLEEIVDAVQSDGKSTGDKIVRPNFKAQASSQKSQIPTNSEMEGAIARLMGLLAQLEGELANWGNEKSKMNSEIGQILMKEMQAKVTQANKDLSNLVSAGKKEKFWSTFTKVAEGVVGFLICAVAILCGQPELAVIVFAMTVFAISGGMQKATDGIADLLQKAGCSPEVAKVLASTIMIVASIVVTMLTCGAFAAVTATEATSEIVVNDSFEMVDMGSNAAETSTETTAETAGENSQSFLQRAQNFFSRVGRFIKTYNPLRRVPKFVNLGIVAGSMAVGDTNFGQNLAAVILAHEKDSKKKEALTIFIEIAVNLLAALAGMSAGVAIAGSATAYQLKNFSNFTFALKGMVAGQVAAGLGTAAGEFGSSEADFDLAKATEQIGITQAILNLFRSLSTMNTDQAKQESKLLSSELKAKNQELAATGTDVIKPGSALAEVLRS